MTNEEFVSLIQGGDQSKLSDLWMQVEKFVALKAHQRIELSKGAGLGGAEFEDLYNSGYLALVAAAETYDPDAGRSFIGWLSVALKTAFAEAGGYRSLKQARDPIHRAGSLDSPVGEDGDTTIGELIADPRAHQDFQNAEDRLYLEQLHDALEKAMELLPAQQSDTIRRRFYENQSLDEIAAVEGVCGETVRLRQMKGLRTLRDQQELQRFVEERTPYYMRVGVADFQRTGESAVERIVFRRERLTELRAERPKLDRVQMETQAAELGEDYINAIDDAVIRIFFRLRFLRGLSWKEVADIAGGGKSGASVRDACLRYLNKHPATSLTAS